MESDTSLTLIDESSSFQILDNSESFVLLDSVPQPEYMDLNSRYDAEDEWLQLETGSVISSMSLVLKPDGSIQSEYSILDNMHASALNEGCKLIRTRPDIYVEDQTMRKILEYISMFSDEVTACLKLSRSAKSLVSSQKIEEDWEISSLVDLDDISIEALGLLLDTLEEFGMYKLCLIVCNRYSLGSRIGRYVVGLASKYSYLNETKFFDLKGGFQVQKAAVAYTAVHNMLEMINPEYIRLKEKDGKDLGIEAFQGLLLLGYWKKLVYIMDFDNSMALTNSFADFKNYKQAYLIRKKNSDYDLSKEDFLWVADDQDIENMKIALDSVLNNFHGFMGIGQNRQFLTHVTGDFPEFPEKFKYNRMLWKFFMKVNNFQNFYEEFCEYLENANLIARKSSGVELETHDFFTSFIQILFASGEPAFVELWEKLDFYQFERFLKLASIVCRELTPRLVAGNMNNLFSIFAPLGVRRIVESEVNSVLPFLTHALAHRSSCFVAQIQSSSHSFVYPDLEGHFAMIPISGLKSSLFSSIIIKLKKINVIRNSLYDKNSKDSFSAKGNLFGEIFMNEFINYQVSHKQHKLDSYNYLKLNSSTLNEYKNLKDKYKDLIQLGETDKYSEMYLRLIKGAELKKLEKRLRAIENLINNSHKFFNEYNLMKIVKLAEVNNSFPQLTKSAQLALMTVAQNYIVNAEMGSDGIILKNMWVSYHLFKAIGRTEFYLEVVRNFNKKLIKNGIKFSRSSLCFQVALGFADIDAYFYRNNYYEAYETIISIFESDFTNLEMEYRSVLLTKATICWLLSNNSSFEASPIILNLVSSYQDHGTYIELPNSVFKSFSPRLLLTYTLHLLRELNITELQKPQKDLVLASIHDIIYMIIKYCGENQEIISMIKSQENIILLEIAINSNLNCQLSDFIGIDQKGWSRFQSEYSIPGHIKYEIKNWQDVETVNRILDSDWAKETFNISQGIRAARIIVKSLKKNLEKKNILHDCLSYTYCNNAGKILMPSIYRFHSEIMDLNYKAHMRKVLDYHHMFSKFILVAQLYKAAKNIESEVEKKLSDLNEEIESFRAWHKAITPEIENPKPSRKRKYKMRWPMRFRYTKKGR